MPRSIRERRLRRDRIDFIAKRARRTIYTSFHTVDEYTYVYVHAFNRENTFGNRYIRRSYRVSQLLARRERHNHDDAKEKSLNSTQTTALSRPIEVSPPPAFGREERRKVVGARFHFREKLSHQRMISCNESGYHRAVDKKPRSGKKNRS